MKRRLASFSGGPLAVVKRRYCEKRRRGKPKAESRRRTGDDGSGFE